MKHLLYDLWFILRNHRYLRAHGAFWAELIDWWHDYDLPDPPGRQPRVDFTIHLPSAVWCTFCNKPGGCDEDHRLGLWHRSIGS